MLRLIVVLSKIGHSVRELKILLFLNFSDGHGIVSIEGVFNSERFTQSSVKSGIF